MSLKKEVRKALKQLPFLSKWLDNKAAQEYLSQRNRKHPQFQWQAAPPCPRKLVEAASGQVDSKLFLFGGYMTLAEVSREVYLFDLAEQRWEHLGQMPIDAPQTHNATVYDGENHIYLVGGQLGGHCSPASNKCFAFHIHDHTWTEIQPLPEAHYMPIVHLHDGRLHCISGTRPDRCTPADQHWSIAIDQGKSTEKEWQSNSSFPSPRTHTASLLIGDEVFVLGGQSGDVPAIEGSTDFLCNFATSHEVMHRESYAYNLKTFESRQLCPLPINLSHSEHSIVRLGSKIVLLGGVRHRLETSDIIIAYDLERDTWEEIGRLPYSMKCNVAAYWNDKIYIATGQYAASEKNLRPRQVTNQVCFSNLKNVSI
jgi:N-acetylneuraminic acid mutarotase